MDSKRYFKITNAQENHNGFQYVDGLNVLDKPFEKKGTCVAGGLYFSDAENITKFVAYGIYLREITFPLNDPEFKMVKDPSGDKWRANKIILGKKYDLWDLSTFEMLISLGASIKVIIREISDFLFLTCKDFQAKKISTILKQLRVIQKEEKKNRKIE